MLIFVESYCGKGIQPYVPQWGSKVIALNIERFELYIYDIYDIYIESFKDSAHTQAKKFTGVQLYNF